MGSIPKKTLRIAYIETLKTDMDRLIYNCGGILGIWFGLTPIKTVELIRYLFQIYNNSRDKIKRIAQNLVTIFNFQYPLHDCYFPQIYP